MSFAIKSTLQCTSCKKNFIDEWPTTPTLHCVACNLDYLLCTKCSVISCPECGNKLKDKEKTFPKILFNAIKNNDLEEIKIIYRMHEENIDVLFDERGNTPLIYAATNKNIEICQYLIDDCNASVSATDCYGRTALIELVRERSSNWSKKLADLFQKSINVQDHDGRTALMFASKGAGLMNSKKGNISLIKQLLEFGADPLIKNKKGYTALGLASLENNKSKTSSNQDVVHLLEQEMIKFSSSAEFYKNYKYYFDEKGDLILGIASEKGKNRTVRVNLSD